MSWRGVFNSIRSVVYIGPASRRVGYFIFLKVSPFLIPLFQFVNSSIIFIGPMSIPLVGYVTGLSIVVKYEGWTGVLDHILRDLSRNFGFGQLLNWEDVPANYVFPVTISTIQIVIARILLYAGLGLLLYSLFYFFRNRGRILDGGPYRFVRHPQYLAILMITAGLSIYALWTRPVWMIEPIDNAQYWVSSILNNELADRLFNYMVILSIWLIEVFGYFLLTKVEERNMESRFKTYLEYKKTVPFISWIQVLVVGVMVLGILPSIIWSMYP